VSDHEHDASLAVDAMSAGQAVKPDELFEPRHSQQQYDLEQGELGSLESSEATEARPQGRRVVNDRHASAV